MGEITYLEDRKPHAVIRGKAVHVIPVALLRELADGKASLDYFVDDPADRRDIIQSIINDWLTGMGEGAAGE